MRAQHLCCALSWPVGQVVKTPPFHGGNMGSSPVRVTKNTPPACAGGVFLINRDSKGAVFSGPHESPAQRVSWGKEKTSDRRLWPHLCGHIVFRGLLTPTRSARRRGVPYGSLIASNRKITTPLGQQKRILPSVSPPRFLKSPPARTASIMGKALSIHFWQKSVGQPYLQTYVSPISCSLRQSI